MSKTVRVAITLLKQALIDRYRRGYREDPESDEEVAAAHAAGLGAITREPWA
jgi:hypothetical protein